MLIQFVFAAAAAWVGWQIVALFRQVRHERAQWRNGRIEELARRAKIYAGIASEDMQIKDLAFRAAIFEANSALCETVAGLALATLCGFLAAFAFLLGQVARQPFAFLLSIIFVLFGLVASAVAFARLIGLKFFQRDISAEYRASIDNGAPLPPLD